MRGYALLLSVFLGISSSPCAHAVRHSAKPTVAADGSGQFATLQAAVDALPATGGVITIAPAIGNGSERKLTFTLGKLF